MEAIVGILTSVAMTAHIVGVKEGNPLGLVGRHSGSHSRWVRVTATTPPRHPTGRL